MNTEGFFFVVGQEEVYFEVGTYIINIRGTAEEITINNSSLPSFNVLLILFTAEQTMQLWIKQNDFVTLDRERKVPPSDNKMIDIPRM